MNLPVEEVLKATGGTLLQGEGNDCFKGVSTDSREVVEGKLFIALKGIHFDGHYFAIEALKKGAGGVLIDQEMAGDIRWDGYRPKAVIAVRDTLRALGDLARERRRKYRTPVVALTGSNGKTTTKEMISACLETTYPILKTRGNLNNLIGLPLTLLNLTGQEKAVVLEMGMNVPGEIRRLTEIAEPDVGVITNIQEAHLEGLGSLEKVQEEKGALFRGMKREGTILVNRDDPRVVEEASSFPGKRITFGVERVGYVMGQNIRFEGGRQTTFTVWFGMEKMEIRLPVIGSHFVPNALAAVAAASHFGIEMKKVKEALERFRPISMRMEVVSLDGGKTLINDTYNANPGSVKLALETLTEVKGKGRAIAVLGDMLELGDFAEEAHREMGRRVKDLSVDFLISLGEWAPVVSESARRCGFPTERVRVAESHSEAVSILKQVLQEGDCILIKGSRGMGMEMIVKGLTEGKG